MTAQEYVNGLFDLTGHVGIITGASRGIGLGEVEALCNAGAEIYNFDVNDVKEDDKKADFWGFDRFHTTICDVTDYSEMEIQIKKIAEKHGHIDFLINNAGITLKSRAEEFPEERLDAIININLKTPFMISRLCYPYLKRSPYNWKDHYDFIYGILYGV